MVKELENLEAKINWHWRDSMRTIRFLSFDGRVRVDGTFRGKLRSADVLEVGARGRIDGECEAREPRREFLYWPGEPCHSFPSWCGGSDAADAGRFDHPCRDLTGSRLHRGA